MVVGLGDGVNFLASDALVLAGSTDRFSFLGESDVVEITLDGARISLSLLESVAKIVEYKPLITPSCNTVHAATACTLREALLIDRI